VFQRELHRRLTVALGSQDLRDHPVDAVGHHQAVDHGGVLLTGADDAGVPLAVVLEGVGEAEPADVAARPLHLESVGHGLRTGDPHRDLPRVPLVEAAGVERLRGRDGFEDARGLGLEPDHDEEGLVADGLVEFLQCFEFEVMHPHGQALAVVIGVGGSRGKLEELLDERGRCQGDDGLALDLRQHVLLELLVLLHERGGERDLDVLLGRRRDLHPVLFAHNQGHVADAVVDRGLRPFAGCPGVAHVVGLPVFVAEGVEGGAEPLPSVERQDLGEQIEHAVGAGGAGEADVAFELGTELGELLGRLRGVGLQEGGLIPHDHVGGDFLPVEQLVEMPVDRPPFDDLGDQHVVVDEIHVRRALVPGFHALGRAQVGVGQSSPQVQFVRP